MKKKLLEDKKVLITGGSRGLGRALCRSFAREGAQVAFNFNRDQKGAEKTLAAMEEEGKPGRSFQVSVLDVEGLKKMVSKVEEEWGRIDILVNNAGKSQPLPFALMEEEDWDQVMDLNVKGYFLTLRAVLRGMIRRKEGRILNISSLAGLRLIAAPVHYASSKAAIKGFTESLSKEMARYNIRVNCLAPGLLEEGMGQNLPDHRIEEYEKHVALGRQGTLEEVARFAAFMVSDRNSYMNGTTILMDGGF